ncbi:MAG: flippase [Nitrospiraceae bacterium]|nr:MAG: flippase [Nitrospiraceae bacterium]
MKEREDNLAAGARGGAVAFLLKISNTGLGFLNQVILARILGAGGLGEVILAITVVRISSQIAKFGMEETMMKFIPLYLDGGDESRIKGTVSFVLRFCLLFSLAFMIMVFLSSRFISLTIFHSEGLLKLLPVIVIALPAWVLRDVAGGVLRGYRDAFRALLPEALVSPLVKITIFLLLTLKGVSPLYAVVAFVTGEIISCAAALHFLRAKLHMLRHIQGHCDRRKVLEVAYTIIFTGMSVLLYTQADIWILGMFTDAETVGIYGIASKLVLLVYFPMMAFSAIVPSVISSVHASGNHAELQEVVRESTRWILSLAMPIILLLLLEGETILRIFFGPEFAVGYPVVVILIAGQLIKAGAGLIGMILQMTGEHRVYMKVNIFWGLLNILLNVLLVPRYGMIGAAAATALCLVMVDIICIVIIQRRLAILTLARGLQFDIVFVSIVATIYLLVSYNNLHMAQHMLLAAALAVYLWKSLKYNDIPWRLLLASQDKAQ